MGVRGLTTYLQSDPRNFIEYQLHNTTVIIDGLNFLNFLYFDSGLYTQFNGEYLAFSGVIHRFINILKRCNINPIFVLDGCHDVSSSFFISMNGFFFLCKSIIKYNFIL